MLEDVFVLRLHGKAPFAWTGSGAGSPDSGRASDGWWYLVVAGSRGRHRGRLMQCFQPCVARDRGLSARRSWRVGWESLLERRAVAAA